MKNPFSPKPALTSHIAQVMFPNHYRWNHILPLNLDIRQLMCQAHGTVFQQPVSTESPLLNYNQQAVPYLMFLN
jgi:hypothetical protein